MAGQTIVRRAFLFMTIDAEAHRVVHYALRDRHRSQVAVTGRAIHSSAHVRRVIEAHVRLFKKTVNALPRRLFASLRMLAQSLNSRIRRVTDAFMTRHTEINARYAGPRPALDAGVAFLAFDPDLINVMDLMREVDRLLRLRPDIQEMLRRIAVRGVGGGELR